MAREEHWSARAHKVEELTAVRAAESQVNSIAIVDETVLALRDNIRAIVDTMSGRNLDAVETDKLLQALSSHATALDKAVRARELLTGGPDSRASIDLASLIAARVQTQTVNPAQTSESVGNGRVAEGPAAPTETG